MLFKSKKGQSQKNPCSIYIKDLYMNQKDNKEGNLTNKKKLLSGMRDQMDLHKIKNNFLRFVHFTVVFHKLCVISRDCNLLINKMPKVKFLQQHLMSTLPRSEDCGTFQQITLSKT